MYSLLIFFVLLASLVANPMPDVANTKPQSITAAQPDATKALGINKKEYKLEYYIKANWFNSFLFCRNNEMRLATINSQEEQEYLVKYIEESGLKGERFWISGADLANEGRFSWYSTGKMFKYNHFAPNQPDNLNKNEHCVEFSHNTMWNDMACSEIFSFVCETLP